MNKNNEKLAHALKLNFGTLPDQPSESQLNMIKQEIVDIIVSGKMPTKNDWRIAVFKHCPKSGFHKYAGIDNSDLNALLVQAMSSDDQEEE